MNLKQFKYVLVLAREGSFSKAAEVLNISQPSLSQYVKKIEKEIGLDLFDRSGGYVRLTDAGQVYLDAGRRILDIERQMVGKFSDINEYRTGTLTIGTSPFRSAGTMPAVAAAFQKKYPGIRLVIHEADTVSLIEGMEHGDFDLCLTMLPIDSNLFSCEKIAEEEMILAVPSDFPPLDAKESLDALYPVVELHQIQGQRFVELTESQYMQRAFEKLCREHEISVVSGVVVKSLEAQIEMVKAGVGMAFVPADIASFCRRGEVRFYSFRESVPKREIVVIWKKGEALTSLESELIALLKAQYANCVKK